MNHKVSITATRVMVIGMVLMAAISCTEKNGSNVFTAKTPNYRTPQKDYIVSSGTNYFVHWANGDRVNINGEDYSMQVDESSRSATIAAEDVVAIGGRYYAAFPARESNIGNDGTITITLPEETHYTTISQGLGNGSQHIMNPMVATTTGSTLEFQNLCSMIRVGVSSTQNDWKLVAVEVESDVALNGTFEARYQDDSWNYTQHFEEGSRKRTLLFDEPLALTTSAKDIYLSIPEVSVTTFVLRFYIQLTTGEVVVYERSNCGSGGSRTFDASTLYNFGDISVTASGIENYSSVTLGSADNPYPIFNGTNFRYYMGRTSSGKHYRLRNDITCEATVTQRFSGTLEGRQHTLTIAHNGSIFQQMENATVRDITISATGSINNPSTYSDGSNTYFGLVACYSTGSTIERCTTTVNIINLGANFAGGLMGYSADTIRQCVNKGNIESSGKFLGGIVGRHRLGHAEYCRNEGSVALNPSNTPSYLGGITGESQTEVIGCENNGDISYTETTTSGSHYIGGISGQCSNKIEDCINRGTIICGDLSGASSVSVGGIVGQLSGSNLINCMNIRTLQVASSSITYVGGLVGQSTINTAIANSGVAAEISGLYGGGIIGEYRSNNLSIDNCYYYGTLESRYKGGIVGTISSGTVSIRHCYYSSVASAASSAATITDCGTLSSGTTVSTAVTLSDNSQTQSLESALNDRATTIANARTWRTNSDGIVIIRY